MDEDNQGSTRGGSVRVPLQPVVASVAAPLLDRMEPLPDEGDQGDVDEPTQAPSDDLPWRRLWSPSVRSAPIAISFGIGVAVGLVTGDLAFGAWSGLFAWFVSGIRSVSRHVSFSFADGFIGYRPDTTWPHGVQEDDDVRWDWKVPREPPEDEDASIEDVRISRE